LFLWCLASGSLVPLPDDVPQVWAGVRIAQGEMSWFVALPVAFVAVLVRDAAFFGLGRVLGERALTNRFVIRVIPASRIATARASVEARGPLAVLVGRFSVGVRTATFFAAGALGVRRRDFLLWDMVGLIVTVPLMTTLGYVFGDPVVVGVLWVAARAKWAVPLAIALVLLGWWVRSRTVRGDAVRSDPAAGA
jgi:membrane protein DedA with SNARE-associated domain